MPSSKTQLTAFSELSRYADDSRDAHELSVRIEVGDRACEPLSSGWAESQHLSTLTPFLAARLPSHLMPEARGRMMAYEIRHGPDQKALKAKQALNIKIYDRTGAEVAIAELEKRAEKEIL